MKLNDICNVVMGQSPSSKNYTDNPEDTLLIQGNADLDNGKIKPRLFTKEITKTSKKGDIILTVRAPVGDLAINEYTACIGRGVCSISGINNKFLFYLLKSLKNKHIWDKLSQGSTFESIRFNDIKNIKLYIPSNLEQERIGNFLSLIDEKIELLEKSLILNERVIQSFSNSFFKDLNYKNSEITILSKICTVNKGEQLNKEDMISNGKYYVLNGGKEPSGYADKWNVCKNTITISEGGNSCGFVNFNFKNFWAGGHCYYLSDLKININLYYLYYYLKENQNKIMRLKVGSGLPNIQKKDIKNLKIKLPNFKKQKEISDSLLILNKKLEINRTKLKLLKTFKEGLLQKMFV